MAIDAKILFSTLIQQRTRWMSYILAIVRNDDMVEDVFQEVCALAYERREQIHDLDHLSGWLRETARRQSLKALQQRARQVATLDIAVIDQLEDDWKALSEFDGTPMQAALRHCLHQLAPTALELVRLRYAEGISGQNLANRTGRKLNTVYVTLSRIHRMLGQCIRQRLAREAEHG